MSNTIRSNWRRTQRNQIIGFCHPLHPNLEPSIELSYCLGVLKGDGFVHVHHSKKRCDSIIGLNVNDFEFADTFANALKKIGLNPKIISLKEYAHSTTNWRTIAYSFEFVEWYNELTLPEIVNLLGNYRNYILAFFQGLYESEGCFWMEREGHQKWGNPRCMITVSNTDKDLLITFQALMSKLGFDFRLYQCKTGRIRYLNSHIAHFRKPVFRLDLQKREQVRNLLLEIQPCIARKQWREDA